MADPATFLASNSVLGPYFSSKSSLFIQLWTKYIFQIWSNDHISTVNIKIQNVKPHTGLFNSNKGLKWEESDLKLLPGRGWEWEWEARRALEGVPCWQGLCGHAHTLSTRIEYDPVVSKWRPDLYPSRFKGACHVCWNRGVDSHTWQLLAHTVLMLLLLSLRAAHCPGLLVPANSVGSCSGLMLLPLPVRVIVQTAAWKFTTNRLKSLLLFRPRVPRAVTLKRGQQRLLESCNRLLVQRERERKRSSSTEQVWHFHSELSSPSEYTLL